MESQKEVYRYDKATGEYKGIRLAYLCPVTQERYNIPANSVEIAPPEHKNGFARVLSDGKWIYVEDKRGTPIYNCATGQLAGHIQSLVYALPEGLTVKVPNKGDVWTDGDWKPKPPPPPPPPLTKEEKKAQRKALIQSAMRAEADDLAFEVLAGEIDKQVWLDKRAEIKQRFPKEE